MQFQLIIFCATMLYNPTMQMQNPAVGLKTVIFDSVSFEGVNDDVQKLENLIAICKKEYPDLISELLKTPKKDRGSIRLEEKKEIAVAGKVRGDERYYLRVRTIVEHFRQDGKNVNDPNKPSWATTQCMVLVHEIKEAQTNSHSDGENEENKIRSKLKLPLRWGNSFYVPHEDHYDDFITIGDHIERIHFVGKDDFTIKRIEYLESVK